MENKHITIEPMDGFNKTLVANVHPPDWVNPEPAARYNLVVIGGGTAGLVTAAGAAGLGAKVALIEKHLLGGDCLNTGCVPSKAFISAARLAADIKNAAAYGIKITGSSRVDFAAVMERVRAIRAQISQHDSAKRFSDLGVDVFLGDGYFIGGNKIAVGETILRFKRAVIATGARAIMPKIDGIETVGCLTNETVFSLTEQPHRLAIIGGGPIGCELAQAFQRLGTQVILLHSHEQLLNREDPDAASIIHKQFKRDGIDVKLNCTTSNVRLNGKKKIIRYICENKSSTIEVDEILMGAGRAPNVDGLNLEAVNVNYDNRKGVEVNDRLQTTNPHIYAAGDICMKWKFTHAADAAARIIIQNALFFGRKKLSSLTMPWCTYTEPEIAHVGLYEKEAKEAGIKLTTFTRPLSEVDRSITEGHEEGFVKIHLRQGTDKIIGATIVARHAGEMISELTLAMVGKVGLGTIASVIHPYPTEAEGIKQAGDAYNRTRLTPFAKKLFTKLLAWWR
ncbi:MAG: mercuric reductase [Victivallaceae bacterium]|nr:mercuric reductase [Victivallaceae bacterium]